MTKKEFWTIILLFGAFVLVLLGVAEMLAPVPVAGDMPALSTSTASNTPTPGWWTDVAPFCTWTPTTVPLSTNAPVATGTSTPELNMAVAPSPTLQPSITFPVP